MERFKFVLKVIGIAVLATAFVIAWGIIIANEYGISNVPTIILSSVSAIAVIALSFFTYSYMKSTKDMADEMKATRDMEFEMNYKPRVTLDFEVKSSGLVYIVVMNEGNGAARNVSFHFEPSLTNSEGWVVDRWPALKNGVNYLAPKKRLTFIFDDHTKIAKYDTLGLAKDFIATIEYEWNIDGKPKIIDKSPLELSPYLKTDLGSYKDISTLINEVEKIRKNLEQKSTKWAPAKQG